MVTTCMYKVNELDKNYGYILMAFKRSQYIQMISNFSKTFQMPKIYPFENITYYGSGCKQLKSGCKPLLHKHNLK